MMLPNIILTRQMVVLVAIHLDLVQLLTVHMAAEVYLPLALHTKLILFIRLQGYHTQALCIITVHLTVVWVEKLYYHKHI